jgi:hypothetical protein
MNIFALIFQLKGQQTSSFDSLINLKTRLFNSHVFIFVLVASSDLNKLVLSVVLKSHREEGVIL